MSAPGAARAFGGDLLRSLRLPVLAATAGLLVGLPLASAGDWVDDPGYAHLTAALLAVGLYASAYGISRPRARQDLGRIVVAVTAGVALKAALTACVMVLAFRGRTEYVVLAVAMAQIDPLSVAALMGRTDMSERARSLLFAWASFDDPVTTILVVYAGVLFLADAPGGGEGLAAYRDTLLLNAVLVAVAALAWWGLRRAGRRRPGGPGPAGPRGAAWGVALAVLVALLAAAAWQFLMLGVAVTALFFRPALGRWIDRATWLALLLATLLLGVLLADGVRLLPGLVLGAAIYGSQIVVSLAVSRGLSRADRVALSLGQQNGITAIILALLLQPQLPEAVGTIAPAILMVNVLHAAANGVVRLRPRRPAGDAAAGPPPEAAPAPGAVPPPAGRGGPDRLTAPRVSRRRHR